MKTIVRHHGRSRKVDVQLLAKRVACSKTQFVLKFRSMAHDFHRTPPVWRPVENVIAYLHANEVIVLRRHV